MGPEYTSFHPFSQKPHETSQAWNAMVYPCVCTSVLGLDTRPPMMETSRKDTMRAVPYTCAGVTTLALVNQLCNRQCLAPTIHGWWVVTCRSHKQTQQEHLGCTSVAHPRHAHYLPLGKLLVVDQAQAAQPWVETWIVSVAIQI